MQILTSREGPVLAAEAFHAFFEKRPANFAQFS